MSDYVSKKPRIAFLGTGAQGASTAAEFAAAGLDVTFIDQWPDHIEAMRKNGITVNLPTRQINAKVPALHLCQVAEIKQPFDLVFLRDRGRPEILAATADSIATVSLRPRRTGIASTLSSQRRSSGTRQSSDLPR